MKIALISTTIHVPKVLALYRKLGPDVKFFVAGDEKTQIDAYEFCKGISNCEYYPVARQRELRYACSEHIGWNNDSRRNIALLEAVKWGADIIVSIDDDMIPLGFDFFERFEIMLSEPYSGLQFGAPGTWCDVGKLTIPPAAQRGLPLNFNTLSAFSFTTDVQIGAMQGIILGVPDTDAGTAMARRPIVHSATSVLQNGFVINPQTTCVFNSQLTAFRRNLAPCFAQFYKMQGRNTDVFSSLIMRRIMCEHNLHTYFGPPFGYHARSDRDLRKDLEAERWGTERVDSFSRFIDSCILPSQSTIKNLRWLYRALERSGMYSKELFEAAAAFLDDMEKVL